jgi:5-formyltetrahydrofolate cyclo-ligase
VELSAPDTKRALRRALLQDRDAAMAAHAGPARLAIRDRYLSAFDPPAGIVVSAFWPMAGELDLRPLLEALHDRGCVCGLPVVVGRNVPLVFRSWEPGVALVTSRFGIAEPAPDRPAVRPRHALVPLLAFRRRRAIASATAVDSTTARSPCCAATGAGPLVAIGVGLEAQRRPALPREPFDERLDWLVTEEAVRTVLKAGLKTRNDVRGYDRARVLFTEPTFLFVFLPVLLALYFLPWARHRNLLLAVASVVFYASGGGAFTWLILASIAVNYVAALAIDRARGTAAARRLLALTVGANLLSLATLKYAAFLTTNVNALLQAFGARPVPVPAIVLPIGISFFTFHAISYVVDVYRRDAVAQKGPVEAALYLLLFPQLIAGPIVRYRDIASQLSARWWGSTASPPASGGSSSASARRC